VYRVRRRRALLVAALALAFAYIVVGAGSRLFSGRAHVQNGAAAAPSGGAAAPSGGGAAPNDKHRSSWSALRWPLRGQAAIVVGNTRPLAGPDQQAAPIASLAKVMTAFLTLKRYALSGGQAGFTVTMSGADAQAEAEAVSEGQSGVAVQVGEQLTERQLLEALLIPSGNNIAETLADEVAGGQTRFVAEMNAEARALGMHHTIYTDPSGFDPRTESTAADQLRVFRQAMRFPVFRQIVSMASVMLPVAGTLTNFNPLIAAGYAGKTGSDSAAGGCLAFFTHVTVRDRRQTAAGVVMGQGEGSSTSELLAAAGVAAQQLVASATHAAPPSRTDINQTTRGEA
jgi:D-alanyl-D-alanine carboxypeptidase (penicillin-binding protein 5/6)